MGCGDSSQQTKPIRKSTVTGLLKITLVSAHIQHLTSTFFDMDPYVIMKFSNQKVQSNVKPKGSKNPQFNETFKFHVNSCFKQHGRNLIVEVMDQNKTSDTLIGFGMVDLDPIVNFKLPKQQIRCFINWNNQPAGFVNLVAEFKEDRAVMLTFRFETASIRRKTSVFGSMYCRVQASIGQQVLSTSKQKDTPDMPPVWKQQKLEFNVPSTLKEQVSIVVYDDKKIIGQMKLELEELLIQEGKAISHSKDFCFVDGSKKVHAGELKFSTFYGDSPAFEEIKTDFRKESKEKKQQKVQSKEKLPEKKPSEN